MTSRTIVLDANVLIRAVLGTRVPGLLAAHAARVTFLAPDTAFDETRAHLPAILARRGKPPEVVQAAMEKLKALAAVVVPVPSASYATLKDKALVRIGARDPDDC